MACELPIVATNVDGAREAIVNSENGFLHEPHDVDGMAESVSKLIESQDLRLQMGRCGRSRVMEFDIGKSVDTVDATYRRYLHL
jgi:glycosyltransferase involved in cell wall biosynthesis